MTRLHELVSRLLVCPDLTTALQEVLEATIELNGADKGNVQLLNEDTGALEIVAHRGFGREFLDFFREVRIDSTSACGQAMRSGRRSRDSRRDGRRALRAVPRDRSRERLSRGADHAAARRRRPGCSA